jgi:alkylation response protein AidB-like acyl-CoA dehydrogenase
MGKPIAQHQAVAFMIADMAANIEAVSSLPPPLLPPLAVNCSLRPIPSHRLLHLVFLDLFLMHVCTL